MSSKINLPGLRSAAGCIQIQESVILPFKDELRIRYVSILVLGNHHSVRRPLAVEDHASDYSVTIGQLALIEITFISFIFIDIHGESRL